MQGKESPFPASPEELTTEWLTTALRSAGALDSTGAVSGFEARPVAAQGTTSIVVRIDLDYAKDGPFGLASVAAKFGLYDEDARASIAATGACIREVRFFRQMMAEPATVAVPRCFAAEIDRESGDFVLLLEDLSEWTSGDIFRPKREQVSVLLREIAPLHARYWNDAGLSEARWLAQSGGRRASMISELIRVNLPLCQARFPEHIGPHLTALAEFAIDEPSVFGLQAVGSQTLLHGDLHIQNAMFLRDGARVIDWQSCFRGPAIVDVSRALVSSLTAEDRRQQGDELLREYCDSLAQAGCRELTVTEAQATMAIGLLHSVMVYLVSMPIIDLSIYAADEAHTGVSILDDYDALNVVRRAVSAAGR